MRHILLVGATLLLMMPEANAQRVGLTVGTNFQRLSDISLNSVETLFEQQTGWHLGAWVDVPLGPLGIRVGARYMEAGKLFAGLGENFPIMRDNFNIALVDFNVLLRYGLSSPIINPYVFAGPSFRIPARADQILKNDLAALSYALEIGGGLEIKIGSLAIYPEIAYLVGLSTFIEDELVLDFVTLTAGDAQYLNTAILRLSVGL